MKLFDERLKNETKRKIKIWAVTFACVAAVSLIAIVLCLVFVKEMTRAAAQTVATICLVITGCLGVYAFSLISQYRRIITICTQAEDTSEKLTAKVTALDDGCTTYRFLPFRSFEVLTEDNQPRKLYLFKGELKENAIYVFTVNQNIVCEYEEIL